LLRGGCIDENEFNGRGGKKTERKRFTVEKTEEESEKRKRKQGALRAAFVLVGKRDEPEDERRISNRQQQRDRPLLKAEMGRKYYKKNWPRDHSNQRRLRKYKKEKEVKKKNQRGRGGVIAEGGAGKGKRDKKTSPTPSKR